MGATTSETGIWTCCAKSVGFDSLTGTWSRTRGNLAQGGGHCMFLVVQEMGGACVPVPNPCHHECKVHHHKKDLLNHKNCSWTRMGPRVITLFGMIVMASVVTNGWLVVAIYVIMTITRVPSWAGATTITSIVSTFKISKCLVSREMGGRTHRFAIVWMILVMTDTWLPHHIKAITLACMAKKSWLAHCCSRDSCIK